MIWRQYRLLIIFLLFFAPLWFYASSNSRHALAIFIIASIILAAAIDISTREARLLKSISRGTIYVWLCKSKKLKVLKDDTDAVERLRKAIIKSFEEQTLGPLTP